MHARVGIVDERSYAPRGLAWLLCVMSGCGATAHTPEPEVAPLQLEPAPTTPRSEARITLLPTTGGHTVPVVVVHTPEGLPLELLLDTGAGLHVVSHPVFTIIGGEDDERSTRGIDGSGVETTLHVMAGPALTLAGRTLEPVLHAPLGPLAQWGIAGVFSPTRMASGTPVQLDLAAGLIRVGDDRIATTPDVVGAFESCEDGTIPHPSVRVVVDGVPLTLALDTGSNRTIIRRRAIEGTALATRAATSTEVVATAQNMVTVERLDGVPITIGGRTISASILRWEGGRECEAGALGWEALVGCLIDFDGPRVAISCPDSPPPIAEHVPPGILVAAVEIAPACEVDAELLRRATHPVAPWTFGGWVDIVRALGTEADDVPEGDVAGGLALVTRACRDLRETEPVWQFAWQREAGSEAFTLLAEVVDERPAW